MQVSVVYINTYRYDFESAKICIASIRYWYPDIPILLIKDLGAGDFDTTLVQKTFKVGILNLERQKLGWGYGKLEPLFLSSIHSFLVIDSDTVFTGKVLDKVLEVEAPFIVDDEVQENKRFNEIYYDLNRIQEIAPEFKYPKYSFNSGQWFGTSGLINRNDFNLVLKWTEPPTPKSPDIFFNGDQGLLNFIFQSLEQSHRIKIKRIPLMIYPTQGNADFIQLESIKKKEDTYPFIIHWAGMKMNSIGILPRADILKFYLNYYYSLTGYSKMPFDIINRYYLHIEKKLKHKVKSIIAS